jgi:hypothetical protein
MIKQLLGTFLFTLFYHIALLTRIVLLQLGQISATMSISIVMHEQQKASHHTLPARRTARSLSYTISVRTSLRLIISWLELQPFGKESVAEALASYPPVKGTGIHQNQPMPMMFCHRNAEVLLDEPIKRRLECIIVPNQFFLDLLLSMI